MFARGGVGTGSFTNNQSIPPDFDLQQLEEKINLNTLEINGIKDAIKLKIDMLERKLNEFAEQNNPEQTEQKLYELILVEINKMQKKYMERNDTVRLIKAVEKQINALFEMVMSKFEENEDKDPVFTTKGLSCASCTKDIKEMSQFRGPHVH